VLSVSGSALERATPAGDSPVRDKRHTPVRHLSTARHVKAGPNLRGPSRKAKYSLATDSEPSSASERWEEPLEGEYTEPETTCLQAVGARLVLACQEEGLRRAFCMMILRLKISSNVKPFCGAAEAKASLNRALVRGHRRETT